MKTVYAIVALGLFVLFLSGPRSDAAFIPATVQATNSVAINVSTATTTQLVALSAGKQIVVTSAVLVTALANNITFEYGTGTACATGTTLLTGAMNFAANGGLALGVNPFLFVPAGNALCMVTSAATQASGTIAYAQF